MAIFELFPYDMHTVSAALIAAPRDFWARLPELSRSLSTARLLMVADSFDHQAVLAGFQQHAVSAEALPPLVWAYRSLFEQHIEHDTQTTRFMRLFLIFDSNQPDEATARLLSSYGLRARPLAEPVPLPFSSVSVTLPVSTWQNSSPG